MADENLNQVYLSLAEAKALTEAASHETLPSNYEGPLKDLLVELYDLKREFQAQMGKLIPLSSIHLLLVFDPDQDLKMYSLDVKAGGNLVATYKGQLKSLFKNLKNPTEKVVKLSKITIAFSQPLVNATKIRTDDLYQIEGVQIMFIFNRYHIEGGKARETKFQYVLDLKSAKRIFELLEDSEA